MAKCLQLQDRAGKLYERAEEAAALANGLFTTIKGEPFAKVEMTKEGVVIEIIAKTQVLAWEDIGRFEKWLKQVRVLQWSK